MSNIILIDGNEYKVTPLRCKHLKQISKMFSETNPQSKQGMYSDLERWMPFVLDSLKKNHPEVTEATIDEMTLQEFTDAWTTITSISGIKMVTRGEVKPMVSTGEKSMDDSAAPSDGLTLQ